MKKLVSTLLLVAMLATLVIPVLPVSAAATSTGVEYTFDDWKNPFFPYATPTNYETSATAVASMNNNPALLIYAMRPDTTKEALLPFKFTIDKTYIIEYDVAIIEQLGSETVVNTKLIPVIAKSTYAIDNGSHYLNDYADVTAGTWNHKKIEFTVTKGGTWNDDLDVFGFKEEGGENTSTFMIDNLVIIEKDAYATTYPSGVTNRGGETVKGYDKIIADYNTSKYAGLHTTKTAKKVRTNGFRGDSTLRWSCESNDNLFTQFDFQANETYKVSFDIKSSAADTWTVAAASSRSGSNLQNFTGSGFATEANTWKHVELTLTPSEAATYFFLDSAGKPTDVYIDNFAIAKAANFPSNLTVRTKDEDKVLRENFNDGEHLFFNGFHPARVDLSTTTMVRDGVEETVLKWTDKLKNNWDFNKVLIPYNLEQNKTYIISFDIYLYDGNEKDTIAIFGVNSDYRAFETREVPNDTNSPYVSSTDYGGVEATKGQWVSVQKEITIDKKSQNYLGLMVRSNGVSVSFYLDNFTIALKNDCATVGHTEGVRNAAGDLTCAVCGDLLNDIDYKGWQESKTVDNKKDIRLIFGVDSLEWAKMSIRVSVNGAAPVLVEGTKVYTSVKGYDDNGAEKIYTAQEKGSNYLAALVLTVSTQENYTIVITPAVVDGTNANTYSSAPITITVNGGTVQG